MQFDIDEVKIEQAAKWMVAVAAGWALIWKVLGPLCRWFRDWLKTGERISSLVDTVNRELKPNGIPMCEKIDCINKRTLVLAAREQLKFENSHAPSYECDANGACIAVNPAWCKLFGVSEHNMLGNGWLDVILDAAERERVMDNWLNSVRNRYPHRERYKGRNIQTGEILHCESATVACTDKSGNVLLYCGTITIKGKNWS